jgi:hypothetical protein
MRKLLKLFLTVETVIARNGNESVVAYGRTLRSLHVAGFWSLVSGGRFCVAVLGRNIASVALKTFMDLI